ncbi:MAG: VOC family protein [Alphaproteobacteria bacterium]|nr:VOC family protein [Alphaproteobacteria bacterium]MDD9841072.1 VOC family protein [Alphaproteobacteria bacterium]
MAEQPSIRFQRANFLVSDLPRALSFYRDVLGFEVEYIIDAEEDIYGRVVFETDNMAKLATLSAPNQPRVMALTEIDGEPPTGGLPKTTPPNRSIIVLEAAHFDEVIEGANALQLKVYPEGKLETPDGRVGREQGILDWDGNLTVIYKIL